MSRIDQQSMMFPEEGQLPEVSDVAGFLNQESSSPLLLVCEHAGKKIPRSLNDLGLSEEQRELHIAFDIGAEQVSRSLAKRLSCRLILQNYSRLVIDCNRKPGISGSIPETSDSILIPGNQNLSADEIKRREEVFFQPFADLCIREIARPEIRLAYSIHSFTPRLHNGKPRPWHISFLYRDPCSRGDELASLCKQLFPELTVGRNEPYFIDEKTDWFVPVCAEPRNIPHSLIEIRNDQLRTPEQIEQWVERLYKLFTTFMETTNVDNT